MLQIGDFSRLTQVSIKALRFYDEIGLLKPAQIDPLTHYRYYIVDQLPRLNRIIALKELGFTLEQITRLLEENMPVDQIKGMLKLRQAEVEQSVQAEMARLARIQARLDQIESEGHASPYEIVVKPVEAQTIAFVRRVIPSYADIPILFGELFRTALHPISPPFVLYHDREYREHDPDVELAVAVAKTEQRDNTRLLEGGLMATTIHQGSYEALHSAYSAMLQWLARSESAYRMSGAIREIYLVSYGGERHHSHTPDQFITEIQIPIEGGRS